MSNPSPEKTPVLLESEQAKEDPRGAYTSEQQAEERCRDSVHQARTELKQTANSTRNTENSEHDDQPSAQFKLNATHAERRNNDDSRVQIPTDALDQNKLYEQNKLGFTRKEIQEQKQTSYPEAQPSYDAKGNLNHIDIMPNKDLQNKNNW